MSCRGQGRGVVRGRGALGLEVGVLLGEVGVLLVRGRGALGRGRGVLS